MNSSKDQSQLTIEELMEIAKNPLTVDENKGLAPVRRFIIGDGVEEGTDEIPAALVWDRYLNWATINNIEVIGNVQFFKELRLYFNKKRSNNGITYSLSQNGFDMSPEYLTLINSAHVAKRRTSSGKKNQNPRSKKT